MIPCFQFFSSYEAGSDSENSSVMGFGSTYTLPLNPKDPIIYSNTIASQQSDRSDLTPGFGSTYTKDECRLPTEHRLNETYTQRSTIGENFNFLNRSDRVPIDGKGERSSDHTFQLANFPIDFIIQEHEQQTPSTDESRDSFVHGGAIYNLRPQHLVRNIDGKGRESHGSSPRGKSGIDFIKRDTDTTSNDGSESTVMSLGQKIQIMAKSPECRKSEENWDSEWKQLLKQNHELLLKLSSREDLTQDSIAGSSRNIEVHDSGVQTVTYVRDEGEVEVKEEIETQDTLKSPEDKLSFDSDPIDEIFESKYSESEDVHDLGEPFVPSKSPECVLEDIMEESSNSDKSSPRIKDEDKKEDSDGNISKISNENNVKNESFPPHSDMIKKDIFHSATDIPSPQSSSPEPTLKLSSTSPGNPPDPTSSDFSCTADLPTYYPGSAITCLVRTSSRLHKDRQARTQPSKDLLDALKMIEEDEKRTMNENKTKEAFTGSETDQLDVTESEITSANTIRYVHKSEVIKF